MRWGRSRRAATAVLAICAATLLHACGEQPEKSAASPTAGEATPRPPLYGRWRILEVNGAPARSLGGGPENAANVSFGRDSYGGSSGCNSFSGTGFLVDDRWFGAPPLATQQGCGELTGQESAVLQILAGGPTLVWEGPERAVLRTAGGVLRLGKIAAAPAPEGEPVETIAGTRWELFALDGARIELPGARQPPRLTFEADRWRLETPCAAHSGALRQMEGAIALEPRTAVARGCRAELARPSRVIAEALKGRLRYVIGPNEDFVLAGERHWVAGSRDVRFASEERQLLSGEWRVISVDGAPPPASERPAELAFGRGAYAVWDGCQHSEGVSIATERQLFTHGSGVVSMANCPPDEVRRKINAMVAASPRIARTADDGLALVSRVGTLRLKRSSARAFGTGVETQLQAGVAFDVPARKAGPARLTLRAGEQFTFTLACGSFGGRWRAMRGSNGPYARFSPERPPEGCGSDPDAARLYNFFAGDVLAAIGPNRDIALFVSNGAGLAARLAKDQRAP